MRDRWKYLVCGALSGTINGLFGGGGGMIFIPLATRWARLDAQKAFATCLGVIFPMTAMSAVVYLWRGGLTIAAASPYIIGGTLGGIVAGRIFKKMPVKFLRKGLSILILYGAWRSLTC